MPSFNRLQPVTVKVTPPALGVTRTSQNNVAIRFEVIDLAGSGSPRHGVLVGVAINSDGSLTRVGTRLPAAPATPVNRSAPTGLCAIELEFKYASLPTPPGPSAHLLLLVYEQVADIGALPLTAVMQGPSGRQKSLIKAQVERMLDGARVADFRGALLLGLIPPATKGTEVWGSTLCLAAASCQFPSDILDRTPADTDLLGPPDATLGQIGQLLDQGGSDAPSLLLLAGDQVYIDATAGLFDPRAQDDRFRIPYERRLESRGFQSISCHVGLDIHSMLDDHEIQDNWAIGDGATPFGRGLGAYWTYQRRTKPANHVWWTFSHQGFDVFMGDTRTEREHRSVATRRTARIMCCEQWRALQHWLVETTNAGGHRPKFVLTPSAMLPRRLEVACDPFASLHSDAWDGYPASFNALLAFLADNDVGNVVFLSGDEHISGLVEATVENRQTGRNRRIWSIHSSALYAPYPFANAVPADFEDSGTFLFPSTNDVNADQPSQTYMCTTKTLFAPRGDGFTHMKVYEDSGLWHLRVTFFGARGRKPCQPITITFS